MPNVAFSENTVAPLLVRLAPAVARDALAPYGWHLEHDVPPRGEVPAEVVWLTTRLALLSSRPAIHFIDDHDCDLSYFLFTPATIDHLETVRRHFTVYTWDEVARLIPTIADEPRLLRALRALDFAVAPRPDELVIAALRAALHPRRSSAVLTVACEVAAHCGWRELRPLLQAVLSDADDTEVRVRAATYLEMNVWG
jgi:hypothetical protein